jgi:hypothetical protein
MTSVEYELNQLVIYKKKLILGFVFNKFIFQNETMYIIQFTDGSKDLLSKEDLEPYYKFDKIDLC